MEEDGFVVVYYEYVIFVVILMKKMFLYMVDVVVGKVLFLKYRIMRMVYLKVMEEKNMIWDVMGYLIFLFFLFIFIIFGLWGIYLYFIFKLVVL